jgi:hypothetical protein
MAFTIPKNKSQEKFLRFIYFGLGEPKLGGQLP